MATDQAASGPSGGNAGEAKMTLGQTITAVLDRETAGAADTGNPPADIDDALTNPEVAKLAGKGKNTGDDREGEDAAAATDDAKDTKDKAADPAKDGDAKTFEAPKHWTDADKQAFAGLKDAPALQEITLKIAKNLEGGFTRKSQELSDKAKFADGVRGLFDDETRAQLRRAGQDEAGAIRYLLDTQRYATKEPVKYVQWAMQNLGVTAEMLGIPQTKADGKTAPAAQPDQQQATGDPKLDELLADPAVKQLRTELAEAKQMIVDQKGILDGVTGRMTERERAEHAYSQSQKTAQTQQLQGLIGEFRSTLDDAGQLAYPHFDAVYRQMGAIMDTDPKLRAMADGPDKMAAAYRKVVTGDPELSQPIIEAEVAKRMAAAEKKAAADRAKRATAVRPASGAPTQKTRTTSVDDAISAALNTHGV